eukprot:TRINITY_DN32240_c0_g1_i1.p1 TRINITY_DN32240_c0_g1~~TRINITY_DN32240_c0_g1_i1.p1  ORF type:complete len:534 (-),score=87.60 TRINITY_DN32240_c0_g1_i1:2-1603(-)
MDVETTEQLWRRLADTQQRLEQEQARKALLVRDVEEAGLRQALRERISMTEDMIRAQQRENRYHEDFRNQVDNDTEHHCDHVENSTVTSKIGLLAEENSPEEQNQFEVIDCSSDVFKMEYEWTIGGMSWLESTLAQSGDCVLRSDHFTLKGKEFDLLYSPTGKLPRIIAAGCPEFAEGLFPKASLVIRHFIDKTEAGIAMRYRFLVKDPAGEFVPWGNMTTECHTDRKGSLVCGPDLQWNRDVVVPSRPIGIFGMSHGDLLKSNWVKDDTLTVKIQLEVRLPKNIHDIREQFGKEKIENKVNVPGPTLQQDLLCLYNRERRGDVTFVIDGARIPAHEAILCVRSEVFDRELSCGMREAACREIHINDIDVSTFKVFLKFLYTDDLSDVEKEVNAILSEEAASKANGSTGEASTALTNHSPLLRLLCVSHKYQVTRLQLWCENQLCKFVSAPEVCSILCQAHLHQAAQLEKRCLSFIKAKMAQVATTPGFADMAKRWPEVMVKINLFIAGVSDSAALAVVEESFGPSCKRQKRD